MNWTKWGAVAGIGGTIVAINGLVVALLHGDTSDSSAASAAQGGIATNLTMPRYHPAPSSNPVCADKHRYWMDTKTDAVHAEGDYDFGQGEGMYVCPAMP